MAGKIFTNIKMLFVAYMIHQLATILKLQQVN